MTKIDTKLQNIYPKVYNFLIAQDLWRAYYQFLSIIFRKEFIELNVNTDMMIKNVELAELNINIVNVSLSTQNLKKI